MRDLDNTGTYGMLQFADTATVPCSAGGNGAGLGTAGITAVLVLACSLVRLDCRSTCTRCVSCNAME
jgi:hypothetical protein